VDKIDFTKAQEDYVCYVIGDWYLKWKVAFSADCKCGAKQHRLGFAKENLKRMLFPLPPTPQYYVLEGTTPVARYEIDSKEFAEWLSPDKTVLKKTKIGSFIITTFFNIFDRNWLQREPQLFVTSVYNGDIYTGEEMFSKEFSTYDEAIKYHDYIVEQFEAGTDLDKLNEISDQGASE
jgi:hypothetical protein